MTATLGTQDDGLPQVSATCSLHQLPGQAQSASISTLAASTPLEVFVQLSAHNSPAIPASIARRPHMNSVRLPSSCCWAPLLRPTFALGTAPFRHVCSCRIGFAYQEASHPQRGLNTPNPRSHPSQHHLLPLPLPPIASQAIITLNILSRSHTPVQVPLI
jgi:hypothetical protein